MSRATHRLLIPLAALLTILPLILHGGSCGHDEVFHVQGWFDAAAQLRRLHYPHWSTTSAWSAGEPRFLFYPPLSWLLGALLTLVLPPQVAVYAFIFLCLSLSGLTMYSLALHFTSPDAALLAATLYLANPYMLFNAFERTAFAELLAAAWIPLLLLSVLRTRPTLPSIAIPFALLWLTNAPAAVMASYAFALLATLRVAISLFGRLGSSTLTPPEPSQPATSRYPKPLGPGLIGAQENGGFNPRGMHSSPSPAHPATAPLSLPSTLYPLPSFPYPLSPASLALTYILGTLLGLALPAFFLIPAAYEQRFIQTSMALVTNMRIQDNFFFHLTADSGHNGVNLQISFLGSTLLAFTVLAVLTLLLRSRRNIATAASAPPPPTLAIAALTATLTLMLLPLSLPLWNHIPELAFLQFPWRLLTLLSALLTFTLAILLHQLRPCDPPNSRRFSLPSTLYPLSSALLALLAFHLYTQFCQPNDRPAAIAQLLQTHHGFAPTDEYTPTNADSDVLRTANPAFWLAPADAPNTPAPNTQPTPSELNPALQSDDTPVPPDQAISAPAPTHLTLSLPHPEILILNLRDYPAWQTTLTIPATTARASTSTATTHPPHFPRDDGLLAIPLPAGPSTLDIHWRTTPDQQLGLALSAIALLLLLWLSFRSAAKEPASSASIPVS